MNKENIIVERIQNFLYSFYAKDIKDARKNEIYHGLCYALMQDIGRKWVEAKNISLKKNVYILSFEYLPGKFLQNNIRKLKIEDTVKEAIENMGFDYDEIMEFEPEASLGNGHIGIGSSYLIEELTKNKIKTVGYCLRYEGGNMKQIIKNGMQIESTDNWLINGNKWEHKKGFNEVVEINKRKLNAIAYDIPIICEENDYVNTLRLWSSRPISKIDFHNFSKGDLIKAYDNYIKDSSITQFLYLDNSFYEGKLMRLKQEYFYSYASINDIFRRCEKHFDEIQKINDRVKIIVSDNHPALSLIEFVKVLHDKYDFTLKKAINYARDVFEHVVFLTTDDSYESYDLSMLRKINEEFSDTLIDINNYLIEENPEHYIIENSDISFNRINKYLSNKYSISSYSSFKNFKDKDDYKINNINIGIDKGLYVTSVNKKLKNILNDYDITDFNYDSIKKVQKFKNHNSFIDDIENVKFENKKEFIYNNFKIIDRINPYSIFDIQTTNFHEAHRQLLNALSIADIYYQLKENSSINFCPTTYIISGKANEGYYIAKENIKFILALKDMINKDRSIKEKIKIVFIENLNVTNARLIYPTSDIYTNLTLPIYDNNGFEVLNASMNFSNIISTRGGLSENITTKSNNFYLIGKNINDFILEKNQNQYKAKDYYYKNDRIKNTVDNLINEPYGNLSYNFKILYDYLINYNDSFHVLKDIINLSDKRIKASTDYLDKKYWVNKQIDNILWANEFCRDKEIEKLL